MMTIITTKSGTMINVEAAIKYDVDSELSETITTHIEQLKSQSNWIKCSDRLPEGSGIYPACALHPKRDYVADWQDALCYFNAEAGPNESQWQHSSGFYDNGVTHWLELPPAPTGEG